MCVFRRRLFALPFLLLFLRSTRWIGGVCFSQAEEDNTPDLWNH